MKRPWGRPPGLTAKYGRAAAKYGIKGTCHPGGHYWDYHPGTPFLYQVTSTHLKSGIDRFYLRVPDLQMSSRHADTTWYTYQDNNPAMTARQQDPLDFSKETNQTLRKQLKE